MNSVRLKYRLDYTFQNYIRCTLLRPLKSNRRPWRFRGLKKILLTIALQMLTGQLREIEKDRLAYGMMCEVILQKLSTPSQNSEVL